MFVVNNTDVEFDTMVTLTYPAVFPEKGRIAKRHLNSFLVWLRRLDLVRGYLWFMEFQNRGAVHFHILVALGGERIEHKLIARRWFEIVGSGDEKHLKAGTRIERLRSSSGGARYACTYASKQAQKMVPDKMSGFGRFWGHSKNVKPRARGEMRVTNTMDARGALAETTNGEKCLVEGFSVVFGAGRELIDQRRGVDICAE